jgi:hypothetical protein
MSFSITEAFVLQYQKTIQILSQQKISRLRDKVRVETGVNGKRIAFERLGSTTAVQRTTRHGDTPLMSSPHSRRWAVLSTYHWADMVDDPDKIRMLIDPTNEYNQIAVMAMNRTIDDVIIAAAWGTAITGEEGTGSQSLPSGQVIGTGNVSMSLSLLLSAREKFELNDVDPDEPKYLLVTPKMMTSLLNTTEVKSADYNTVKALVQGQLNNFLGFEFVVTNRLPAAGVIDSYRNAIGWAKNGVGLAVGRDITAKIDQRPDKAYSTQVYVAMDIGAVRIEDEKVIRIPCLATD